MLTIDSIRQYGLAARRKNPERDIMKGLDFFEEFCWLMEAGKKIDFNSAAHFIEDNREELARGIFEDKAGKAENLIGELPKLLNDESHFPTSNELASFAKEALGMDLSMDRSRYEMIGRIVCKASEGDKRVLAALEQWARCASKDRQADEQSKNSVLSWTSARLDDESDSEGDESNED
ncbi:MAG: hypothetical protein LBU32_31220 [Clostridiales bacterium]|jgi:hypothetical protein|nr:hypothetical protein [Clostridiales bacterium]